MNELALSHGQMVRLVVRPARHETDKAKTADAAVAVYMGAGPSVMYAAQALEAVDEITAKAAH